MYRSTIRRIRTALARSGNPLSRKRLSRSTRAYLGSERISPLSAKDRQSVLHRRRQRGLPERAAHEEPVLSWQQFPTIPLFVENREEFRVDPHGHRLRFARVERHLLPADQPPWLVGGCGKGRVDFGDF